jgi:type II secretory pathway pseudopilin PulG
MSSLINFSWWGRRKDSPLGDAPDPGPSKSGGFSLVEVALALACIGCLGSVLLPCIQQFQRNATLQRTLQREEQILYALAAFLHTPGRLPCPAPTRGNRRGVERLRCQTPETFRGIVPFRTLGLSESTTRGADGGFFVYVVHPELTITYDFLSYCGPHIRKLRELGGEDTDTLFDPVAVVLESHLKGGSTRAQGDPSPHQGKKAPPRQEPIRRRFETRKNLAACYGRLFCPHVPQG